MNSQFPHLSNPQQRQLQQALHELEFGDFQQRWDATKSLARLGTIAIQPLIEILEDDQADPEVQWFVMRVLGQFETEAVINALVNLLNTAAADTEEQRSLKQTAALALGGLGSCAIAPLTSLLEHETLRPFAVEALAQIRHPDTLPALLQVAEDGNPQVRSWAIEALSSFHDRRVVPVLLRALQDPFASVRKGAVTGLGMWPDVEAEFNLVEQLQPLLWDIRSEVSQQTQIALGRLGTDQAATALYEQIQSSTTPMSLKRDGVRALGWLETPMAFDYLRQIFQQAQDWDEEKNTNFPICQEIIRGLGQAEQPATQRVATDILIEWLNSDHPAVTLTPIQQSIALSLGQLGQVKAVYPLVQHLSTVDTGVRLHCIAALKKLDPQFAHQRLTTLAQQANLPTLLKNGIHLALSEWD